MTWRLIHMHPFFVSLRESDKRGIEKGAKEKDGK